MSDLKTKGLKAFIWDLLGNLGTHASSLIVTIFLARLLEPSDFGLIAIIMVIVSVATIFSDVGLGGALIQRSKLLPIHYSSVFFFNITAGFLLTLLTYLSAGQIATFYNNPELLPLIQVMSSLFIISAFHAVQSVILRKELNYELLTKVNLIASVLSGVIGVLLAFWGAGVWSLVAQLISREVLINILIWSRSSWVPTLAFSFKALKQLWGYGMNMFLAGLLDTIYERADYLIIGKLFAPATLGFFHQAKQLNMLVVKYSAGSLMSVLFPVLSKIQNDLEQFRRVVIKSTGIISFVTFLILGGLFLVADELIVLLLGAKWEASIFYFKILALSGFAYPISALMVNVLSSRGKSRAFLKLEIYKKIIQSITFYVLFAFGIKAFLYSLIVTSALGTSLNIYFAARELGLSFLSIVRPILIQTFIVFPAVAITLFISSQLALSDFPSMLLKGIIFVALYLLFNGVLKVKAFKDVLEQFDSLLTIFNIRKKEKLT
ncbi:lipopolysaccharide biosynthesis protein [Cocleimonas flava]|uniref:O-antigen/teichoic acid export membrane protein n=1 Tax=Cocleimonas flava TaxID=634765 RepID=A0A4R1F0R6_9GAMM|nr:MULTISPECIES: lipopolysaccharide biosynthesis protein [Cocleimonas]MEB8433436.1 lipopolysaccharide biosynthesis protein [Cocleimonas sp. KMM 6892]MEC4716247.1 lipopolysaccharide biosynthesis protein [Cocleimonas sp. KMM 6895]MEC4745860.1 lipopolysaccharide biosynthesis protein [Cocleimonas sp. KMM 6896]TCJ85078.1 O-antigen/teichoic acid export membrane protein [Cocleimonas flava]